MLRDTVTTGGCYNVQAKSPPDGRINFRLNSDDHPELAQALAAAAATGRRGAITRRIIELAEKGLLYEAMALQGRHQASPLPSTIPRPVAPERYDREQPKPGALDRKMREMAGEYD